MPVGNHTTLLYQELADWYERHGDAPSRDQFLVLAADTAASSGNQSEAEQLRQRLLQRNPQHLLGPFASFDTAIQSPDVHELVAELRLSYPPVAAEQLLELLRTDTTAPATGEMEPPPAKVSALDMGSPPALTQLGTGLPNTTLKVYSPLSATDNEEPETPALSPPLTLPSPPATGGEGWVRGPAVGQIANPSHRQPPAAVVATSRQGPGEVSSRPVRPLLPWRIQSASVEARLRPMPDRGQGGDEDSEEDDFAWISLGLFSVLLAIGSILAVYTLVWPILGK